MALMESAPLWSRSSVSLPWTSRVTRYMTCTRRPGGWCLPLVGVATGIVARRAPRVKGRRVKTSVQLAAGPSSSEYDVIVIGAGLGGLACAAALGKAGRKVLVVEAHSVCGGCAHSFTRKAPGGGEYIFDSGPSILTDMGPRNPLRLVLDYVGASEYVEWIHYDGWGMRTPEGPWRLEVGKDSFRNDVLPRYGVPPEEFDEVVNASRPLAEVGRQIPGLVLRDDEWQLLPLILKFPGGLLPAIRDAPKLSEPFSVVLDHLEAEGKMRKGSWLRAWLDALAFSLSGLDCSGTTCAAMAFTMEELHWKGSRGLAYPKGGLGAVVDALVKAVEAHGGEIRTKLRVDQVLLEGQRAVGVRCSKGDIRAREAVVCNAPIWDAAKLLPKDAAGLDEMKQDWQDTPMTRSYLHLHLGLDAEGLDLSKLEPHYTSMIGWEDVTAEQNMFSVRPMSQAVVVRNTFLEEGCEDTHVLDNFRRQVSEPVKMFSSQPEPDQGEETDEDFGPKAVSGLRAVWAPGETGPAKAKICKRSNDSSPVVLCQSMPLELWLECICDQTQFGEDLVVVGNHPVLGNWSVEKAVVLRTDVSTFPLWTLEKPLVLEDDEYMPLWLEYKYLIRGLGETHWEDFGRRSLPIFSSTSPVTATAFLPTWTEVGKPMNRLLPFCRGRRLKPGLMLRVDSYGSWTAMTEASWSVAG
eukprot:s1305_g29.t2